MPAFGDVVVAAVTALDHVLPLVGLECGPCAFCGHHDKRHRIADAIREMVLAGEDAEWVADLYAIPVEHVRRIVTAAA